MQEIEDKENEEHRNEASSPTLDKDKIDTENNLKEDTELENNNIIQETIHEPITNTNYIGLGILSISAVFLITTIITLIFFKKYQLKSKVKTSK